MDPKQARLPGVIVDWYENAAKIENARRVKAGLVPSLKWADTLRVAAAQMAGLPAEYEIDFAWIREEMKKAPAVKGPAKRTKRT
jgi:hypothetical protein